MALSRKYRLGSKENFSQVLKEGRKIDSLSFYIKTKKNNLRFSRFGIVVSSFISKKAVVRNKIRRRLSEAIRKNIYNKSNGYNVIFIVKGKILEKNYKEIEREVKEIFKKFLK